MAKTYANRVWMTTATAGTGTITLGSAKAGYFTFAQGGVANSDTVTYVLIDGNDFEIGTGTYTSSGTTMSRDTVTASLISGTAGTTKLTLSGSAEVFLSPKAADYVLYDANGHIGIGEPVAYDFDSFDVAFHLYAQAATEWPFVLTGYGNSDLGSEIAIYKTRAATPAAFSALQSGDFVATMYHAGSGATIPVYASYIRTVAEENFSDTAAGSSMRFAVSGIGTISNAERMRIAPDGAVCIGTTTSNSANLRVGLTDAGASAGPVTELFRDSSSPAASDVIGQLKFTGRDSAANVQEYALIHGVITDPTSTTEDGDLIFQTIAAGSMGERFRIASHGGLGIAGATYGSAADYFSSNATASPSWNPAPLRGHIWGLTMSNNGSDAANDIDVAAGAATDEGHAYVMVLAASITKRLDAAWAVGTNQGGLNTGAEANSTWYEVHLIRRPDTGVVDVMFTTTANRATLPANYTQQRRIGWIRNDSGGSILPFTQVDDHFTLTTQINDVAAAINATAAAATVTVPPSCIGRFRGGLNVTAVNTGLEVSVVFSEIVEGNVTPTAGTAIATLSGSGTNATAGTNDDWASGHFELRVSTTSTIEWDCVIGTGGTGNFDASTFGWIDARRRLSAV
jgi:hypothetical protein